MNYVILNNKPDEDNQPEVYESFEEFCDAYDMVFALHESWCYVYEVTNTDRLPHDCEVSWFLEQAIAALANDDAGPRLIQFSVSSKESRHQEWLDAVAGVPGHTINALIRDEGVRGFERTVYLCSFPTHPTL